MPNIPTGIDRELESGLSEGLRPSEVGISALDQAGYHQSKFYHQAGEGVTQVANLIDQHESIQSNANINDASSGIEQDAREAWSKKLAQDPQASPDDFMRDYVTPKTQGLRDLAKTNQSQVHAMEVGRALTNSLGTEFHSQRVTLDLDHADASANDTVEQAKKDAYDNPDALPGLLQSARVKVDGLFTAANVPATLKADHFRQQYADIADSAADGVAHSAETGKQSIAQIDAAQAQIQDKNGAFRPNMSAAQYRSINDRLDKARITAGTVNSSVEQVQLGDIYAQMKINGGNDIQNRGQGIIQRMPTTTSEQVDAKARAERNYETAAVYGKVADKLAFAPEDNLPNIAQGFQDAAKGETDPDKLRQLDAATDASRTLIGVDGRGGERAKALAADASGYVNQHSPTASNAYSAWQQNPTPQTWSAYSTVQTALQKQMRPNAPVSLVTPEIAEEARGIIGAITTTPEGAAGASRNLFAMSQKFGNDWGPIAHDLKTKGVLSDEQYVAARLYSNPAAQGTAEAILTASAMKAGDRFNLHGIAEEKARKAAISAVAPLEASLGNANDRAEVTTGFVDAITHVLQTQATAQTPDLGKAAGAIASKIIMDEYQFAGSTHTIRAPANLDGDAITAGSEAALAGIGNHDIVVPRSYQGLNAADQKANYVRQQSLTARWYTNEDASGIKLYDSDMHNILERKNGKVVPVEMKWDELPKTAKAAATDKQPYSFGKL